MQCVSSRHALAMSRSCRPDAGFRLGAEQGGRWAAGGLHADGSWLVGEAQSVLWGRTLRQQSRNLLLRQCVWSADVGGLAERPWHDECGLPAVPLAYDRP